MKPEPTSLEANMNAFCFYHLRFSPGRKGKWTALFLGICAAASAMAGTIAQAPLYLGQSSTPLIMLTMQRDHKLYYEAYNDASDINGDGALDIRYKPAIDYFGYFDSHKCYSYGSGIFTPVEVTVNKKCTASTGRWSGDYLNYLTMSRIDALRRVLYGGHRSTDSTSETILERSYIPQDAHSWGKEYNGTAIEGYDISEYTPLSQPSAGARHLFANTTLLCPSGNTDPGCSTNSGLPLLRVLNDTTFRVWEWLSIERPVAGVQCATGNNVRSNCAVTGGDNWGILPDSYFSGMTQTTYDATGYSPSSPNSHSDFVSLITDYGTTARRYGSTTASKIDGFGNPNSSASGSQEHYLTVFSGNLVIPPAETGSFTFAPTGDDAVEVIIDGTNIAGWYGAHGDGCDNSCKDSHSMTLNLSAGMHTLEFHHHENTGGDTYHLYRKRTVPASTMTDYVVRVKACVSGLLESECRGYPSNSPTAYKPSGILQEYGEANRMAFGLITGSYAKNTSGGVLRKNVSYLADSAFTGDQEINTATGQFTGTNGIVKTIDKLKVVGFGSGYSYDQSCGVPEVNGPLTQGRCRMWGNPTGEMMYEGLRYFAADPASPSTAFSIGSSNDDSNLGLPKPDWKNPYRNPSSATDPGFPSCSRPTQLVISDITPNFDTDQLPGSYFNSYSGDLSGLDVQTLGNTIWAGEYGSGATASLFIGQSGSTFDGAPTPKKVISFGDIRGLTPEEPTQQGGFYAASVALFGRTTDLNAATGNQKTDTFSVALASPLPRLQLPVNGKIITLVPFGKTVGGCGSFSAAAGSYQPTNTIVDFYVDTIKNTDATNQDATVNGGRAYAKFRINYEDSEYGSDHDMDVIVEYELIAKSDNTLDVKLTSGYAAGNCIQHLGYVISGTTTDGTFLEVRDSDTASGSDVDYFLDTPNTSGVALPLVTTRNFSAGVNPSAAFVAHDPLWYAAKWGGFVDANSNNALDSGEWDANVTGAPDTYFLVTNAGRLKEQLDRAFAEIVRRNASSSSVATNSTSIGTDTLIYQARFNSGDWSGELRAFSLNTDGSIGTLAWTTNSGAIPEVGTRKVFSYDPAATDTKGVAFCWDSTNCFPGATDFLSTTQKTTLGSAAIVNYLRGDQSLETTSPGGTFRSRSVLLGDIVNSDPWFVGNQSFGYEDLPAPEGTAYVTFRSGDTYKNRRPMIYVGANDGMLHGFDASSGADGGAEIFAYVPNSVISTTLRSLSAQGYTHSYFVDGSPKSGDAYFGSAWHTVLIGTTGAGGRGVFALDITNPDAFDNTKVLWEFTGSDDTDLGNTMTQATIVRLANGAWGAIFANGYNSSAGKAVLYILNVETGAVIKKIDTGATGSNGLATPIVIDLDNDRIADYVYAGDLRGNLWKFDISSSDPASWGVAYSGTPLFVAKDRTTPTPVTQPITVKPQVGRATASGQNSGVMVYFGTGKYFEVGDNIVSTTPQVQTFYGIWDRCDKTTPSCTGTVSERAYLQEQQILAEGTTCVVDLATGECGTETTFTPVRVTSKNAVAYGTGSTDMKGWFMDLAQPPAPGTTQGERVASNPLLRGERIIFTTLIPSTDPCTFGGTGWLMELEGPTGKRFDNSPFDVNRSGGVNSGDNVIFTGVNVSPTTGRAEAVAASGLKSTIGIIKTPAVVSGSDVPGGGGGGCNEFKFLSGSTGELAGVRESCSEPVGRLSWRQLR